jgi:hypothetical protein
VWNTFGRFLVVCALAAPLFAQTLDDILAKVCPPLTRVLLAERDLVIVDALAKHYRQFEWSPAKARAEGTFAPESYARHAVPSLAAKQVVLLETIAVDARFHSSLRIELQRHGVPQELQTELVRALGERNAKSVRVEDAGKSVIGMDCKELMSAAFGGVARRSASELANASVAISFSLPAYDASGAHAIVLAVNDLEYRLEGKGTMEVAFFDRLQSQWTLRWHSEASPGDPSVEQEALGDEDVAIYQAVLTALRAERTLGVAPIRVVNQTRGVPSWAVRRPGGPAVLEGHASATDDLLKRNVQSIYIGRMKPISGVELVQREVLDHLDNASALGTAGAAVMFSLPGYADAKTAVVRYNLVFRAGKGTEHGEETVLVQKRENGWHVTRRDYERNMRSVE